MNVDFILKPLKKEVPGWLVLELRTSGAIANLIAELLLKADENNGGHVRVRIENLVKPKTYPQLKMVFGILRKIYEAIGGEQWGMGETKGIEHLLQGMLRIACKEFGYPMEVASGFLIIPKPLSQASTTDVAKLIMCLEAFAAEHNIDITEG